MNKGFSSLRDKVNSAVDKAGEFISKERSIQLSQKVINQALQAEEETVKGLRQKGLSRVQVDIKKDRIDATGLIQDKNMQFEIGLVPKEVSWNRQEQLMHFQVDGLKIKSTVQGVFPAIKTAFIRMALTVIGAHRALKLTGLDIQEGSIRLDVRDLLKSAAGIAGLVQIKSIHAEPATLRILYKPDIENAFNPHRH